MSDLARSARRVFPITLPITWLFPAFAFLSSTVVLYVPKLAIHLSVGSGGHHKEMQLAATAALIAGLTCVYLFFVASRSIYNWTWWVSMSVYLCALVAVKFILAPASLHNTPDTTLKEYVQVGLVVSVFYFLALWLAYRFTLMQLRRNSWAIWHSAAAVIALMSFAFLSRYVAVVTLNVSAANYLRHVFSGAGWYLPIGLVIIAAGALLSFRVAAQDDVRGEVKLRNTLRIGLWTIALYHAIWVVYMLELFS